MKKLSLFALFIIACQQLCSAQAITINGTIKTTQGNPIHYAFVKDDKLNSATFTDSLGNFSLKVDPASKITITHTGYSDATVNAANQTNLQVVLNGNGPDNSATLQGEAKETQDAFNNKNVNTNAGGIGVVGTADFSNSKQLIGHRFLFTEWVHGYIVKADGNILQDPGQLFNYDKMKGDLLIAVNLNSVTLGDKNVVKAFTLFYQDQPYTFEKMTGISNDLYSQVLSASSKYKIYKLITTKFVKADFQSNGITSSGSSNDEFVDNNTYYVSNIKTGSFQPLALKKKAFKTAFPDDADKLNSFMSAHSDDKIDDDYLKELGDALNQ